VDRSRAVILVPDRPIEHSADGKTPARCIPRPGSIEAMQDQALAIMNQWEGLTIVTSRRKRGAKCYLRIV
jgi:hypothetical protein